MACPTDEELAALIEGQLDPIRRVEFQHHIARCDNCENLYVELAGTEMRGISNVLVGAYGSRYVVRDRVGQGGMGVVYRASDVSLNRTVAVKLLRPPPEGTEADASNRDTAILEARFLREALITARLQHPSIVPVYQAGRWPTGEPFYSMKLLGSQSFKTVVEKCSSFESRLRLLPHVIAVAEAIAYAHSERIIHRDLKPANVLIGDFGETMVVDWGLAKDLGARTGEDALAEALGVEPAVDQTRFGAVLGTPAYMPPEQARGEAVDERADVYALGSMLYFMLTGVAPYEGDSSGAIVRQLLNGPPPMIESRAPRAPTDLLAIVTKAMARTPEERYPNAAAFAEDLKRFQTGQLVGAQRYSIFALTKRWLGRHRAVMLTAGTLLVALMATAMVSFVRIIHERARAENRGNELILSHARASVSHDPTAALSWLKEYPIDATDWAEARNIAVEAASEGVAKHVFARDLTMSLGSFSRDGKYYVAAGPGRTINVWRLDDVRPKATLRDAGDPYLIQSADGETVVFTGWGTSELHVWLTREQRSQPLRGHTELVNDIAVSSDGAYAASASDDRTVRLWDLRTLASRVLTGHRGRVTTVRFSADGGRIFSGSHDGTVRIWTLANGESRALEAAEEIVALATSRDDRFLVAGELKGRVRIWDLETGALTAYQAHESALNAVDISADGRWIASSGDDQTITLYDRTNGQVRSLRNHLQPIDSVAFSPRGDYLASGGRDGNVVLWHMRDETQRVLRGHSFTTVVQFSPDGSHLASTSTDKTTRLWSIEAPRSHVLRGHTDRPWRVAFAPDGTSIATAGRDGTVRLWSPSGNKIVGTHPDYVLQIAYAPDGQSIVSGGQDGSVRLWDLAHGHHRVLAERCGNVWDLVFSSDGKRLAAGSGDGMVRIWDLAAGGDPRILTGHAGPIFDVAFSTDGRLLASAGEDGTLRLWDTTSGSVRVLRGGDGEVNALRFSRDGKILASIGGDHMLRIWNVESGTSRVLETPAFRLIQLDISPDGATVAAVGLGPSVLLADIATGHVRELRGHTDEIRSVAFSPDGTLLASSSFDRTLRVWSVATGLPTAILRHSSSVTDCAFSPNGDRIASLGADRTLAIWDAPFGAEVPTGGAALRHWLASTTSARVNENEEAPTTPAMPTKFSR